MRSIALAVALAFPPAASAAQVIAVSVEELARTSDAVIRGSVTAAQPQFSRDKRRIETTFTVKIAAPFRGRVPGIARVVVPGGVIGRTGQKVDAAPFVAVGEDVVLFLQKTGKDTFRVNGLAQGKFSVVGKTARPDLSHLQFIQTSVRAGERRAEEMPLDELERRVRSAR